MTPYDWRLGGLAGLGLMSVLACSSPKSGGGPSSQGGASGCVGTECGSGGAGAAGGATSMTGGIGGAAPGGSVNMGGGASTGGQPDQCTTLMLAQGATSPDGITALHSPPADAFGDVYGFSVGLADGFVYFNYQSELMRVATTGGAPQSIHAVKDLNVGFFVIGSELVWVDQDPQTMAYSIQKVPVTASDSTAPVVVAKAIDAPDVFATDATALYFSNRDKKVVYKAPLDGSGVTTVAMNVEPLGAVVVNGTYYFLDFSDQLMSVPTSGGQPTPLASIQFGGEMIADGSTLYWSDSSDETLNRWAPGDKAPTTLAMFGTFHGAGRIAVEMGDVYYTAEDFGCGGVGRVPSDRTKITQIASGFDSASALAVDADNVYVVAWNGVFKLHR